MSTASYVAVRRNANLTRTAPQIQTGPITTMFMLVALVVLLSLIYLNQVSKNSVFSYRISALQQKQTNLSSQQQKLEIDAARLQSMNTVANSSAVKKLVPVQTVSYAQ